MDQDLKQTITIDQTPEPAYFKRLFSGRINRQNYLVGSTIFVLIPLICFLVVIFNILLSPSTLAMPSINPNNPADIIIPNISITSLLMTPNNELWTAIGTIFFIFSLPYIFSLQIRRLHDLNLNSWLLTINFLPLLFSRETFSITSITNPDIWYWVATFVSLISSFFSLYVSVWPGTKGTNIYGEQPPSGSSFLKEVLQIR